MTTVDMNDMYNSVVNNILDAYNYMWKCSGMDLAHPSYAAPPGTVITRSSRRMGATQEARERRPSGPVLSTGAASLAPSETTSSPSSGGLPRGSRKEQQA